MKNYNGNCEFTKEYLKLLRQFWNLKNNLEICDTRKILKIFRDKFSKFNNSQEHDAQEVLFLILDILHKSIRFETSTRNVENVEWNKKKNSLVKDLFYGQIEKSVIYPGGKSVTLENCANVMFTPTKNTSLEELLTDFKKDEVIQGYKDNTDKQHHVAILKNELINQPRNLIFSFNMYFKKFKINIPQTLGNYKLVACCVHYGNLGSGHYIAITKHKGKWYLKDDDKVHECTNEKELEFNDSFYFCIFKNSSI